MRARKHEYIQRVTVDTSPEALRKLCQEGHAIVNNWTLLVSRLNQPDSDQRDYINTVPEGDNKSYSRACIWMQVNRPTLSQGCLKAMLEIVLTGSLTRTPLSVV
jgi:hypothetical protein